MNWILGAIGFVIIMVITIVVTIYFTLKETTLRSDSSKYIVNKFEPDNTAPKITDMIEFHRSNEKIEYKI